MVNKLHKNGNPTFLDLFAGCGGMSLGFMNAGFECLAAIDMDSHAVQTMKDNFPKDKLVLEKDLSKYGPEQFSTENGIKQVDVIVGGPPCQGFSTARQRDGANHGARLVRDPRRFLYRDFLRYVGFFHPSMFVMENVLGIRSASGGRFFSAVQNEARRLGYRVHGEEIKAWRFGVPQKRVRQLIIGTAEGLPIFAVRRVMKETHALPSESDAKDLKKAVTLWEAIGDLPQLSSGGGSNEQQYDIEKRRKHEEAYGLAYLRGVLSIHRSSQLTGHVARPHNSRDLRDFERLKEGEHAASAIARGERMEFPYDRDNFKDRFTRQHRNRLCSTIVAHLAKDGLMFVHPTQQRSLTPREAARVQSFPDTFHFPKARTHAFRMIGNAVPPLLAESIGEAIKNYFNTLDSGSSEVAKDLIPNNSSEAEKNVIHLLAAQKKGDLREIERKKFQLGWNSIGYLFPGLHPDSAGDDGDIKFNSKNALGNKYMSLKRLIGREYALSGWPMRLVPVALEARRRLLSGKLSQDEYYFSIAQMIGSRR